MKTKFLILIMVLLFSNLCNSQKSIDTDEILGVRNDSEIRFNKESNHKFTEIKELKFNLPKGTDELFVTSSGILGVRNGSELSFYKVSNKEFL